MILDPLSKEAATNSSGLHVKRTGHNLLGGLKAAVGCFCSCGQRARVGWSLLAAKCKASIHKFLAEPRQTIEVIELDFYVSVGHGSKGKTVDCYQFLPTW